MNCVMCNGEISNNNELCKFCIEDVKDGLERNPKQYHSIALKYGLIIEDEEL